MNIAVLGKEALEAELKGIDGDLSVLIGRVSRLHLRAIEFVEGMGHDIAQIGDAMAAFGAVHAGLGQTAKGLQWLHAAAHEADRRLLPSDPQRDGGGKTPPPKP
jgi:hypothetical protein